MKNLKLLLCVFFVCSLCKSLEYIVDGNVVQSTRIGLSNNKHIDVENGIYPNNSFAVLSAQLGITFALLNNDIYKLHIGIKGMVGGVGLDTTRNGSMLFPTDSIIAGANAGRFAEIVMPAWGELINAYLSYSYKNCFGFKGGRYSFANPDAIMGTDWWSGHNQGFEIFGGNDYFRIYGIYVHARSSSNLEWLNHFEPRNKNVYRFGLFVFGLDSTIALGHNHSLFIRPYLYYQPGAYIDPGFKIVYTYTHDDLRFVTTLLTLFAIHERQAYNRLSDQDWGYESLYDSANTYLGRTHGKGGITLFAREELYIKGYKAGIGIYKNFGNANDMIGSYGDPTGLNTWVYTLYSTGPTWSDFFSSDALNAFILGGKKYQKWNYEIIGRYTYAPRSNENSLALLISYDFTKHINLYLRLEWAGTLNKPGYKLVDTFLTKKIYTDKSMIFWYLSAKI